MRAMSLRRLAALCCACAVLAAVVLCRVYWIGTDTAYAASAGGQSASLTELPQRRGDFYDRSGRPLTGTVPRWYALCIPGTPAMRRCSRMFRLLHRPSCMSAATV